MRTRLFRTLFLAIMMTMTAFAAVQAETMYVQTADNAKFGKILTGTNGMTLYTFANDKQGESKCYGDCAAKWPPLMVGDKNDFDSMGGKLGLAMRTDGGYQVTYMGKPLYFWINDKKPGDTTGHNVKGVWFVAQ